MPGWTVAWLTSHVSYAPTLTIADFDGDGAVDLAFPDTLAQRVGWIPAGPGTLVDAGAAVDPQDLDAADLDGDGDLDLVVTAGDGLWWYERTTAGAFAPHLVTSGYAPRGAAVGDFDDDGALDLALADTYGLSIWLAGGGTFALAGTVDFEAAASPVATDLDGDGVLDLVAAVPDARWYRGEGAGTFTAGFELGPDASAVVAADLDGDGDRDVAWAGFGAPARWAENVGGGSFEPAVSLLSGATDSTGALAAAELDGVVGDELVFATARRVAGYGGPRWVDPTIRLVSWSSGSAAGVDVWEVDADTVAAGDVDGDGLGDLVAFQAAAADAEPALWVRTADGAGGFGAAVEWSDAVVTQGAGFAELDGDGVLDVATLSITSRAQVRWFPGEGAGGFGRSVDLGTVRDGSGTFAVMDPDGDGLDEVLVAGATYSAAAGALSPPTAVSAPLVAVADIDRDGDPDVVDCATATASRWDAGSWVLVPSPTAATSATSCRLRDLDGDGAPELVTWWLLDVYLRRNAGDGTYSEAVTLPFQVDVVDLDVGDLDGDGVADLAMADYGSPKVAYGDGVGFPAVEALSGDPAESLRVGDWDQDGDDDLATVGNRGLVDLHLQGGGALGPASQVLDLAGQAWFTDAGDADGDGDDDLLFAFASLRGSGVIVNPTRSPPPPPRETADTGLPPSTAHTGTEEPPDPDDPASTPDDTSASKPAGEGCGCSHRSGWPPVWTLLGVAWVRRRRCRDPRAAGRTRRPC